MMTAIAFVLMIFFLFMNAFFVVAEFSMVRVRRTQLELALEEGKKGAQKALEISDNVNAYLSACQLGITLASLAIGWLGEPAMAVLLEMPLLALGLPEATIYPICVAVGFAIITTLHVVTGELIPKSIAIFSTADFALHTAPPLMLFYKITYPIMFVFNHLTNAVVKALGHDPANEREVYTGEELKILIDESAENGLIDPEANEYVDNIFDLGDKDAESIMTPRTEMVCLDVEDPLEENVATIKKYKYTRYPVCRGSKDVIIGFVHTKDLYGLPLDTPMDEWNIRPIIPIPDGMPIARVIETMEDKHTEICVVVDEHGGTAGIVTMTNVVEQIVGRIDDEYMHVADDSAVELPDGTYKISGTMDIDDLEDLMGFEPAAAEDVETAGGLLLSLFDRIPQTGDVVVLENEGVRPAKVTFTVLAMDRLRIDQIGVEIDTIGAMPPTD